MAIELRRVGIAELERLAREPVDQETLQAASRIVEDVRTQGSEAIRRYGEHYGDLSPGAPVVIRRSELEMARDALSPEDADVLTRTAQRIQTFAEAQLTCLREMKIAIPGGQAGHTIAPVERAGCYAPGGRFPLPSSVLMTAVTARVAGVRQVWVASPRPAPTTLGAAAIAGADALVAVGGAHAIAGLAFGCDDIPACDVIVGPGNRWVTAAKKLVSGRVRIDMLAGPSELVVVVDKTTDPAIAAADLLAQAEHDPEALPIVVALDAESVVRIEQELERQLNDLPTAQTARVALSNGLAVLVRTFEEAIEACDRLAPEHLELLVDDADRYAASLRHYGGLFIGSGAAEVLGDYGAGPNHVLPTGGTARLSGGLSVFDFLRIRTWMRIDAPQGASRLVRDAAHLARLEGLEAHARSALARIKAPT